LELSVKLQGVSKLFGDQYVLQDIDLSLPQGSFTAITGPSGCGKSTLLNIIAGLDSCTTGQVQVLQQDTQQLTNAAKDNFRLQNISYVFQFFHLLPTLNTLENVCLPAFEQRQIPKSVIVQQATLLLTQLGLKHAFLKRPDELSGGMQSRVSFARALIARPKLLLADEPTGSLDSKTGSELLLALQQYHQQSGCTVILVTHDPVAASKASSIIAMRDGRIL
jgi:ABC-type lipoprotein export system ATPase subunit